MKHKPNSQCQMTRNRQLVLDALRAMTSHPTSQDLFMVVRKKQAHIGLTTVYRCVEWLVEQGLTRNVYRDKDGAAHYDANMARHDHLICLHCGMIVDVVTPWPPDLYRHVEQTWRFQAEAHTTLFSGTCPECAASQTSSEQSC